MSRATVWGVLALTAVLCVTMLYKQHTLLVQQSEYSEQLQDLKKEKQKLAKEKEDLKDFREYVKTDEYAEKVAREKFGLVKKGEIIFEPEVEK